MKAIVEPRPKAQTKRWMRPRPWSTIGGLAVGVAIAVLAFTVLRQPVVDGVPFRPLSAMAIATALALIWAAVWFVPREVWERRLSAWALLVLVFVACLVPAWMLLDSLKTYRLYGDDFEYIGTSRTP